MLKARGLFKSALMLLFVFGYSTQAWAYSEIYNAIVKSDLVKVKKLLKRGEGINGRYDGMKMTPLIMATLHKEDEIASYLLANGADVNGKSGSESVETPLHQAASSNSAKIARMLIAHGAEINAVDGYGRTPLHTASNSNSPEMVELLLKSGADVHRKTKYGKTPILALGYGYEENEDDLIKIIDLLLKYGADMNGKEGNGYSVIFGVSVYPSQFRVLKHLIENGTDVNTTWDGKTVLQNACRYAPINAQLLLKHGAIKHKEWKGESPLKLIQRYHPEEHELIGMLSR